MFRKVSSNRLVIKLEVRVEEFRKSEEAHIYIYMLFFKKGNGNSPAEWNVKWKGSKVR